MARGRTRLTIGGGSGLRGPPTGVQAPHLFATTAGGHRAPAAAARHIQEEPAAVSTRAASQAGEALRISHQVDGVRGHREAHAARLVVAPLQAEAPVSALRERACGDALRIGGSQLRDRENASGASERARAEKIRCKAPRRPRASSSSTGPLELPKTPMRVPQRSSESSSMRASVASTSLSSSVQSTVLAKSTDSEPPRNLIDSGEILTTKNRLYGKIGCP